jgi:SAM-dependent methyltransferase
MPRAIAEIGRVLRPGGLALISDFHPELAQRGGQRSFTAPDGRRFAVEHFVNFPSDFLPAFNAGFMILEDVIEPRAEIHGQTCRAVLILRGIRQ